MTITVTASTVTTFFLLTSKGQLDIVSALHHLGLWPVSPLAVLQPLLLTVLLYLGPLYNDIYLESSLSPVSELWSQIVTSLSSSMGYRNFVAGPLTEELLFRSTILPLHLLSPLGDSFGKLVFLTPLYFGIAHVHHFYEFSLSHPDTPLTPALLRTIFQFGYTTIFGWYAAFVYLRTGSLYSVFIIHAFCNYMGLPRLWGKISLSSYALKPYRSTQLGSVIRGKDDTESEVLTNSDGRNNNNRRLRFGGLDLRTTHTIIYYLLLLLGVYSFVQSLFPMTDFSQLALVRSGK